MQKVLSLIVALSLVATIPDAANAQNAGDANLLTRAQPLRGSALVIDVPLSWSSLPDEMFAGGGMFSFLTTDMPDNNVIAAFSSDIASPNGHAFMMISEMEPMGRTPIEEIRILEQGVKMSRLLTSIVGSGMGIVRPARNMEISGGSAATMSFHSGPAEDLDIVTYTIVQHSDDMLLIVEIAPKGAPVQATLDVMRRSVRPITR